MNATDSALCLNARQLDILAYMGLPMHGWPIARLPAQFPAALAAQNLLVDTMSPAVRSLRLGDLKNAVSMPASSADAGVINIALKKQDFVEKPAQEAHKKIAKIQARDVPEQPPAVATNALQLWSLDGLEQTAAASAARKILLLLESGANQSLFPLAADALALLRNILGALQWSPDQFVLCALPCANMQLQPADCLPQIALWQPALALVLGRNASRAALGVQLQTASLSALRGQTFDMASVAARVSYPLEYLLRKPDAKASAWQDWLALKWQWEALQST